MLRHLTELDLSYCHLPSPDCLSELQTLSSLRCFSVKPEHDGDDAEVSDALWSSMAALTLLTRLEFMAAEAGIMVVPNATLSALSELCQLQHLDVSRVAMEHCRLPSSLSRLIDLKLTLTDMMTFEVNCNATGLTRLDLDGNRLDWLPEGLCHLQKLKHLSLCCNYFDCLPAAVSELSALTFLAMESQHTGNFELLGELPLQALRRLNMLCLRQWPHRDPAPWIDPLWSRASRRHIARARALLHKKASDLVLLTDREDKRWLHGCQLMSRSIL